MWSSLIRSARGQPDALFAVSLDTGERRQLTHPQDPVFADSDPAISPDGKWLAFRREVAPFTGELTLLPLGKDLTAAGEPRRLTTTRIASVQPQVDARQRRDPVQLRRRRSGESGISGDGTPERLPFVGEDGVTPIVSSPQAGRPARLAYVRSYTDANIWRIETPSPGAPAHLSTTVAISSTRRDAIAHIAPDGHQVAFTSTRSGENEIWRADASGAGAVQFTFMAANPGWPGGRLPANRLRSTPIPMETGTSFSCRLRAASLGISPRIPLRISFPTFSRDGRWVYFSSTRSGQSRIWKIPVSGGAAVQVSAGLGMMAIESPDGAYLYYTESTNTNSPAPLLRIPVAGGPQ